MKEKFIVAQAKKAVERDGYDYIVYRDKDGDVSFTRLYDNLNLFDVVSKDDIVCVVNGVWDRCGVTPYVSYHPNDIDLTIKRNNIKFMQD